MFNKSGSKYLRDVSCVNGNQIDVYAVLEAFSVRCPARQHAIKKLLCAGLRDKGSCVQDLIEARDAIDRAIDMQHSREIQTLRSKDEGSQSISAGKVPTGQTPVRREEVDPGRVS